MTATCATPAVWWYEPPHAEEKPEPLRASTARSNFVELELEKSGSRSVRKSEAINSGLVWHLETGMGAR